MQKVLDDDGIEKENYNFGLFLPIRYLILILIIILFNSKLNPIDHISNRIKLVSKKIGLSFKYFGYLTDTFLR